MNLNLDSWVLPAEASWVDRLTLRVWRFWEIWLRGAVAMARRVAVGVTLLALIAWFVFEGSFYGTFGVLVTGAVIIGVAAGMKTTGSSDVQRRRGSIGQLVVATFVGLPLAFLLIGFGMIGALLALALVVVPVINYPILIVAVVPAMFGAGRLVQWLRRRNDARYPRPASP